MFFLCFTGTPSDSCVVVPNGGGAGLHRRTSQHRSLLLRGLHPPLPPFFPSCLPFLNFVTLFVCFFSLQGEGTEQNFAEAAKWWGLAAEKGNADAQTNVADCYFEGEGVERSHELAAKWYQKAADQGESSAQLNLCNCYRFGFGVPKDLEKAIHWCQLAADQGDEEALDLLAKLKDRKQERREQ